MLFKNCLRSTQQLKSVLCLNRSFLAEYGSVKQKQKYNLYRTSFWVSVGLDQPDTQDCANLFFAIYLPKLDNLPHLSTMAAQKFQIIWYSTNNWYMGRHPVAPDNPYKTLPFSGPLLYSWALWEFLKMSLHHSPRICVFCCLSLLRHHLVSW
jgi:hypothetical protein